MYKKLNKFFKIISLLGNYVLVNNKLLWTNLRIKFVEKNWRLSKNYNFYNFSLAATVYRYGDNWKIARYGSHFGEFEFKEDAMSYVFQDWFKDNNFASIISDLQNKSNDFKKQISDIYEYKLEFKPNKKQELEFANAQEENPEGFINQDIVEDKDISFKAKYFYLARAYKNCYKCKNDTLVSAIILPEGFEKKNDEEDSIMQTTKKSNSFAVQEHLSILSYLTYISFEALEQIQKYTGNLFQKEHSATINYSYYRSICSHCKAAQGDYYVINDCYTSPFFINSESDLKNINFHRIDQAIYLSAEEYSIVFGYEKLCV